MEYWICLDDDFVQMYFAAEPTYEVVHFVPNTSFLVKGPIASPCMATPTKMACVYCCGLNSKPSFQAKFFCAEGGQRGGHISIIEQARSWSLTIILQFKKLGGVLDPCDQHKTYHISLYYKMEHINETYNRLMENPF